MCNAVLRRGKRDIMTDGAARVSRTGKITIRLSAAERDDWVENPPPLFRGQSTMWFDFFLDIFGMTPVNVKFVLKTF